MLDEGPRSADAWGTIAAWAWGASRVMDYLQTVSQIGATMLSQAVRMRHTPELHFHYDDSVDKGERIDALLRDNPPAEES